MDNVELQDYKGNWIQVPVFQLLQWKHAMRLEALGLKHSRGSVTAHVRKVFKCPPKYPRDTLIRHVTEVLNDVNKMREEAKCQH